MQKKEKGFTLIELLISIVILGVLTTLMIPVINMSIAGGSNTSLLRYQTDTLEWYREVAKSKTIYLSTLTNEETQTDVGQVNITYETKTLGNRTYILVRPSLASWTPSFYITPLKATGITTEGIYIKILTPQDGSWVENGSNLPVIVKAYYIKNGSTQTVDSVDIAINGDHSLCEPSPTSSDTYQCSFTVNGHDGDVISIVAQATKDTISNSDSVKIYVKEKSILVVNITYPNNGQNVYPGTLKVYVDSYLQTGNIKTPVEPTVSLGNIRCPLSEGPGGSENVTYTFTCNIPAKYGIDKTIKAEASYGHLTAKDNVVIHIVGLFKIVDITKTNNPDKVDELPPKCIDSTYNYVVVEVDNGIATLWNYIYADFTIGNLKYTSQASNAYLTPDRRFYYVFVPIPTEIRNHWIPGQTVNIEAYIHYDDVNFNHSTATTVCCNGIFNFSQSITDHSKYVRMVTTGTVLSVSTATGARYNYFNHDICGMSFNYTSPLRKLNIILPDLSIIETKIEKFKSIRNIAYVGKFKCNSYWLGVCLSGWEYVGITSTVSTEVADVYTKYETKDDTQALYQWVTSDHHGYNYVDFLYSPELDSNSFEVLQFLGQNNSQAPYCEWHQSGPVAYRAVKYETLQKYTIWYRDLRQLSDILRFFPDTPCNTITINQLTITIEKNNWASFYSSPCDNFPQVAFTVYLSNEANLFNPTYIIDVFKSQIYRDRWGYTIFDSDCSKIQTIYLSPDDVIIDNNDLLRKVVLKDIPLQYLSNLDLSAPIYSWIKYKATEDTVENLTVTLTLTATYQVSP